MGLMALKYMLQYAIIGMDDLYGCITIGMTIVILSLIFTYQMSIFKTKMHEIVKDKICEEGTFCYSFFNGKWKYRIVSFMISIPMAIALMIFLHDIEWVFFAFLVFDIFLFHYIYTHFFSLVSSQLTKNSAGVAGEIFINFFHIIILMFIVIVIYFNFMGEPSMINTHVYKSIVDNVKYPCVYFQDLLRTKALIEQTILSLQLIPDIGNYIFIYFYITSLSFFPALGITFIFKTAMNISQTQTKRKNKNEN